MQPTVAMALMTTAVGMAGVRGLLINDLSTDNDTKPFGVTVQVQQEINSSCGSKVYRLMQIFWDAPMPGASGQLLASGQLPPLVVAPELVKLTNESPMFKLAA